jgi:hypothetical protein
MRGVVGLTLLSSRWVCPCPLSFDRSASLLRVLSPSCSLEVAAVLVWIGGGLIGAASRDDVDEAVVLVLALELVE